MSLSECSSAAPPGRPEREFPLANLADTHRLAAQLAEHAQAGDVFALFGDLGAGKSEFARAFIRARLGSPGEEVPSPTFTLVQQYIPEPEDAPEIWHFDLYRLSEPQEAIELDIEDAFERAITLIEWPERLGALLPANHIALRFSIEETGRAAACSAPDEPARRLGFLP